MAPSLLSNLRSKVRLKRLELRSNARRRALGPFVSGVLVENEDGIFLAAPDDMGVGWQLSQQGHYGRELLQEILPLLNAQSRVLVAGTHIGSLAIPLAAKVASVTGFEANPNTFRLLELNKRLNNAAKLIIHGLALGSKAGTLKFLLNTVNSGGSKREPKHKSGSGYYHDKPKVIEVPMVALDEMMPEATFDFILMDIEGSEPDALLGMQRILPRTQYLLVEYLPHHLDEVAGVTDEAFVSLLSPHFRTVRQAGQPQETASTDLIAFVKNNRATLGGGDLLFSK